VGKDELGVDAWFFAARGLEPLGEAVEGAADRVGHVTPGRP
jgi:hypothetical protein